MGKRILIVDDNQDHRMLLKNILEEANYQVVGEGSDGKEALTMYKEVKPDLVTMDIKMPQSDGIEGIKNIFDYDSSAKIIVTTIVDENMTLMQTVKAIVADYVTKPFNKNKVLAAVKEALEE